ncbi:hypothetical protein HPG69_012274 [Diceros bicornis minor]|uniref:Uncharacterized protein n=1 Tax=Diceros bicornis minor TaxID=77932 RepID=A0A7J7F5Z2_DICBM|nr:hypothetical protein HPG69_012274 [Diceros bicornis minor]
MGCPGTNIGSASLRWHHITQPVQQWELAQVGTKSWFSTELGRGVIKISEGGYPMSRAIASVISIAAYQPFIQTDQHRETKQEKANCQMIRVESLAIELDEPRLFEPWGKVSPGEGGKNENNLLPSSTVHQNPRMTDPVPEAFHWAPSRRNHSDVLEPIFSEDLLELEETCTLEFSLFSDDSSVLASLNGVSISKQLNPSKRVILRLAPCNQLLSHGQCTRVISSLPRRLKHMPLQLVQSEHKRARTKPVLKVIARGIFDSDGMPSIEVDLYTVKISSELPGSTGLCDALNIRNKRPAL